jgi:hypothetical protein
MDIRPIAFLVRQSESSMFSIVSLGNLQNRTKREAHYENFLNFFCSFMRDLSFVDGFA